SCQLDLLKKLFAILKVLDLRQVLPHLSRRETWRSWNLNDFSVDLTMMTATYNHSCQYGCNNCERNRNFHVGYPLLFETDAAIGHHNGIDNLVPLGRPISVEPISVSVDTMAITALPLDCWLKERLKNWVQLSGHEGTIVPATDQTLWKRKAANDYTEAKAYRSLMQDPLLDGFVPRFYKEIDYKNDSFIEIQDLTAQFTNPAIMDIKIGTRTFSECDVQNNVKRADLYQKMIAQNPTEPTDEERREMAITKLRYMQFRERESSTASLGFRIEAAKMPGGVLKKSFKKVKTRDEVTDTLRAFFGDHPEIVRKQFLYRLRRLRDAAQRSYFFKHHEIVGSSLLLVYDDFHASAWMIDFAKSVPIEGRIIDHRSEWKLGNHEDGYFTGLDNLIKIIDEMAVH
uniref:Kinase n=1 Tax=Parascaris univalens TaxID=6257 RepID=A0A915AWH2_PARUN